MIDELITALLVILIVASALVMASLMLVGLPATLHAQAECLSEGYPRAHVTYKLERYCSTLDGAVTVKVTKQQ